MQRPGSARAAPGSVPPALAFDRPALPSPRHTYRPTSRFVVILPRRRRRCPHRDRPACCESWTVARDSAGHGHELAFPCKDETKRVREGEVVAVPRDVRIARPGDGRDGAAVSLHRESILTIGDEDTFEECRRAPDATDTAETDGQREHEGGESLH